MKSFFTTTAAAFLILLSTPLFSDENATTNLIGQLENGIAYHVIPSFNSKESALIKLSCFSPRESDRTYLELLTLHSLLNCPRNHSRQEVADTLNRLGLDVHGNQFVQVNENEMSFQFCLAKEQLEALPEALNLLHDTALNAALTNEGIELARRHLLETIDPLNTDALLSLQSITADEVRDFYSNSFKSENLHLIAAGLNDTDYLLESISNSFDSKIAVTMNVQDEQLIELMNGGRDVNAVDYGPNGTLIVDNKIRMNRAQGFNNQWFGHFLGSSLTVAGISGIVFACVAATPIAPAAIIAGGLSAITGVYFLTADYLKDPYYVEKVRHEDLQKGCAHAYKNHRAGITLTPFERRKLFLQDMIDRQHSLERLPIQLLADLYYLDDPIISALFTEEEFSFLRQIKTSFVQQRNEYRLLNDILEQELYALTAPYAADRDLALAKANSIYDQNYSVVRKKVLIAEKNAGIQNIESACIRGEIDYSQKSNLIKDVEKAYDDAVAELYAGLYMADATLRDMKRNIQEVYDQQVDLCKRSINYDSRKLAYSRGEQFLTKNFNEDLITQLVQFPVELTTLPDYLDLTKP